MLSLAFKETNEPLEFCCALNKKLFYFIAIKQNRTKKEYEVTFGLVDLDELEDRNEIILEYYPSMESFSEMFKNKTEQALAECVFDKERDTYQKRKVGKISEARSFMQEKMNEVLNPNGRYVRWAEM